MMIDGTCGVCGEDFKDSPVKSGSPPLTSYVQCPNCKHIGGVLVEITINDWYPESGIG